MGKEEQSKSKKSKYEKLADTYDVNHLHAIIRQKDETLFGVSSLEQKILGALSINSYYCILMPKQNEKVLQRNIVLASSSERSAVLYDLTLTFESRNEIDAKVGKHSREWYMLVDIEPGRILDKKLSAGTNEQGRSYVTTSYIPVDDEKSNKVKQDILQIIKKILLENVNKKKKRDYIVQFPIKREDDGTITYRTGFKLNCQNTGRMQRHRAMGELMMDAEKQYIKWTKKTTEALKFERQFSEFMEALKVISGGYPE